MNVQLPDGSILQDVPDGTTKAAIIGKLRAAGNPNGNAMWQAAMTPQNSSFTNAVGEPVLQALTGAVATPIAGLRGLWDLASGGGGEQAARDITNTEQALTYQPKTPAGQAASNVVGYPFRKLAQGANAAGNAVQSGTGSPIAGALTDAAIQLAPMALGPLLGRGGALAAADTAGADAAATVARPAGLTPDQQSALAGGQALGMRTTPGQRLGSVPLQQLEAKFEAHPLTSGPFAALKRGNQAVLDKAAAASIGENAPTVGSTTLDAADQRLSGVFNSVRNAQRPVTVDPQQAATLLNQIDTDGEGLLPMSIWDHPLGQRFASIAGIGKDGTLPSSAPAVNAQQLGQLSSKLSRAAYKQMSTQAGDRDLGAALYGLKDHVDDLVQSALSPQEAAQYAAARAQYRNLMNLTSRPGIVNPASGHVSGPALASKLQQADKRGYTYGRNTSPLYQATRFAQAFKPIVGDSGTATRSLDFDPFNLAMTVPSWLASRLYLSPVGNAVTRGLLGVPSAGQALTGAAPRTLLPGLMTGQGLLGTQPSTGLLR